MSFSTFSDVVNALSISTSVALICVYNEIPPPCARTLAWGGLGYSPGTLKIECLSLWLLKHSRSGQEVPQQQGEHARRSLLSPLDACAGTPIAHCQSLYMCEPDVDILSQAYHTGAFPQSNSCHAHGYRAWQAHAALPEAISLALSWNLLNLVAGEPEQAVLHKRACICNTGINLRCMISLNKVYTPSKPCTGLSWILFDFWLHLSN